jgi:arsenite-transporting ATPase
MTSNSFVFFSGKGGVGKTTCACATAVAAAERGLKTLIVSTDPASNVGDVFQQPIGSQVTAIRGVPNLFAVEIDPDGATEAYRENVLAPMRGILPDEIVAVIEEQFRSPCTTEIAAFDRFTDFLVDPGYDLIVFDTAPTGHTLRLLELPMDWSKHIEESAKTGGQTCLGPVASIQAGKEKYDRAIAALRDPGVTSFVFVTIPEKTSLDEARRTGDELSALGITVQRLIINHVLPVAEDENGFFDRRRAMQQPYIAQAAGEFPGVAISQVEETFVEIIGAPALSAFARLLDGREDGRLLQAAVSPAALLRPDNGGRRRLFFMGKGGVGKTVVSAATALHLAREGVRTLLVTTDPAAHTGRVLGCEATDAPTAVPGEPNLFVARVDQETAVQEYRQRIMDESRGRFDEGTLAAMEEELNSPCTEEMAAFERFLAYLTDDGFPVVVFDTAPTGHTLRLLSLPFSWEKQVEMMVAMRPGTQSYECTRERYKDAVAMLQDRDMTRLVFVVLPEKTPLLEALRARDDLAAAGISTSAVVANMVLPDHACRTPRLKVRREAQQHYLYAMRRDFGVPRFDLTLRDDEVMGAAALAGIAAELWSDPASREDVQ